MRQRMSLADVVKVGLVAGFVLIVGSAMFGQARAAAPQSDADVIATERASLERWDKGDPSGFLDTYAPEISYFDPATDHRVDGVPAMTAYLEPSRGQIKIDWFEMLHPLVQRHGEIAVLSYNIVNYTKQSDGTEKASKPWNVTQVFQLVGGKWRTIHSHFSFTKPDLK